MSVVRRRELTRVDEDNFRENVRVLQIPHAWGTVKVQAKGAGYAILQMSVQYNVDIAKFQTQPPVKSFSLVTTAQFDGRNKSHITYTSCARWVEFRVVYRSLRRKGLRVN